MDSGRRLLDLFYRCSVVRRRRGHHRSTDISAGRGVVILHIPRAVAMSGSNETTAVFEALAMSGAAFLVAASPISGSS